MRTKPGGALVAPIVLWIAAGLVLVGCGATASPAPADVLDGVRALASGPIPGAILFVRQGDRSYTLTAGYADKARHVPMRAEDTYPIGSTTKSYTAVLVMRLVEQGKIVLDDPVSTYLLGLLPDGNQITVRELLSHTSGLDDFAHDPRFMAPYLRGKLYLRRVSKADAKRQAGTEQQATMARRVA
jgi:D-alanyl-D-alanine carboxypeptidase